MTTTVTIHDVNEIVTQEKYKLDSGTYVRDIVIKTKEGYENTITLFADTGDNLKIRKWINIEGFKSLFFILRVVRMSRIQHIKTRRKCIYCGKSVNILTHSTLVYCRECRETCLHIPKNWDMFEFIEHELKHPNGRAWIRRHEEFGALQIFTHSAIHVVLANFINEGTSIAYDYNRLPFKIEHHVIGKPPNRNLKDD